MICSNFFWKGSKKVKQFFSINYVKFAEKFNYEIKIDKKWSFGDFFWLFFSIKVPFWGPYPPSKKFSSAPLNLSHQRASFKSSYDYIWSDKFFDQKVAKLVKTQKSCQNRFNRLISHQGSYSDFRNRWIFRKLKIFALFRGVSNENLILTPLERTGKNEPYYVAHNIKKYHRKMCPVFL